MTLQSINELQFAVTLMDSQIIEKYGNRLRVRVCGICWNGNKLLVANHRLQADEDFWAPIGGGVELGESLLNALAREFKEEANVDVKPGRFLFGCEYIRNPLHAVELFFEVFYQSGNVSLGIDPESQSNQQILKEVRFMEFLDLMALNPDKRHGIFRLATTAEDMKKLSGFYVI